MMKQSPHRTNFRLKTRLALLIGGLVVILVLVTGIVTTNREKKTLEAELHKRGIALAAELGKFMARPLLSQDLPTLRRFVNHSMEQDYVLYIMVLDPHGRVVMHSDLSEIGKTYEDRASVIALNSKEQGCTHKYLSERGEAYCDIYSPIKVTDVRLGTIRLGYSYSAVENEITKAQRQIFLIGLVTTVIGGIVAYILATFISSPIKRITEATEKVADGDLDTPVLIKRDDEIGALAAAFNKMMEDLRRTTVSKDYVDNIIESMNDTLVVVNPDARIRTVNKATCNLLGYKEEELIGKNVDIIMRQKESGSMSSGLWNLLREEPVSNHEIDYLAKNGKRIPVLFSAAVLRDKEGRIEGAAAIARDVTERKRAEEALRKSEKELHFLSSQLLTAQENERRRLSIEMHDELGQALMVFKLRLRSIRDALGKDQKRLKKECDEVIGYLNDVNENVRRLSRDLSPSILEDLGLSAAIRWLVEAFTKHCNTGCSLDVTRIEDLFSQESQITIYRIIQECLTNIAKHAQATQVSIVINRLDNRVYFRVEDDGKGFNVKEVFDRDPDKKGIGLAAMCERIRMLGGSPDIWSKEGTGTKITFTIPLNSEGYPK
ncbi:MAG: PAS domain S-box protein [bacterium]